MLADIDLGLDSAYRYLSRLVAYNIPGEELQRFSDKVVQRSVLFL